MENYLYFAEAVVETGDDGLSEALLLPASSYIGADPTSTTTTRFRFAGADGDDENVAIVTLTHGAGNNKEVIRGVLNCINANTTHGGFVVVADMETGTAVNKAPNVNPIFNGDVTNVTIDDSNTDGAERGDQGGTTLWSSFGAGLSGAPTYFRYRSDGNIISKIVVPLDNLLCKGDAANDVIGATGGGAAYIGKYVSRSMGLIYKAEAYCLIVPTQQTATITTDIDIAFNASATLAYDGAAGTAEVNTGGFTYVGDGYAGPLVSAPTSGDYIYLVEGDTTASTGEYAGGLLVITFYGHEAI